MSDILKAIILGVVEGATEFIPVSSTGHLILVGHWLNFVGERANVFEIVIQLGAILAVIWQYRTRLREVAYDAIAPSASPAAATASRRLCLALALAFLPAAVVGFLTHKWITAHPDWYAHRKDGSISYAHDNEDRETDWTDVAELNYGNTAMRRAMIADMTWWLKEMKIDGFRCDVAGGVPLDFWVQARRDLSRVRPDLFMLAEAEGPQYHRSFDMTYGWELHHMLNEISKGKMSTSVIDAYLARQDSTYPRDAYRMYFTSNHDENSWNGTEFERMGANHLPSFILAATLTNSMPLLYTGQEASFNRRLRFFEKDTVSWTGPSLAPFYHAVFDLRHREHALWNGSAGGAETRLQTDGGDKVYAFTRTRGSNTVLVAVNFGDGAASVSYSGLAVPGRYTDWFSHDRAALAASGRLELPAHGYRVLVR